MSEEKGLTVIEQKQVTFYGDEILAVRAEDGSILIPIRPICDLLGVDWSAQRRRINRDPVLSEEMMNVVIPVTDSYRTINRKVLSLPLDYVSGFLFGIDANRVKPELRERLVRYQRECYKVLAEAFEERQLTTDPSFDELLKQASEDVVEAYQIALAIMRLARNQVVLEVRLDEHGQLLEDYGRRLETIEADIHQEDRYITEGQATQISQAVRAIAFKYSEETGENQYGRCWGEFYRKFGVSKYRYLSKGKFDEAMKWLNNWYEELTGEAPF
jgi:hypothetical protein